MFKAVFRKYWCDFASEYEEIRLGSIEEILEYAYKQHKDSVYPNFSSFNCHGDCEGKYGHRSGCLEVNHSLKEKFGYRGSLWLEKVTYYKGNGSDEVIIFSKSDRYISPKANKAFDDFAIVAKQRDENKNFGDY